MTSLTVPLSPVTVMVARAFDAIGGEPRDRVHVLQAIAEYAIRNNPQRYLTLTPCAASTHADYVAAVWAIETHGPFGGRVIDLGEVTP